jgi:diguanylate cyclase (GGDEF)-like protein
MLGKLLALAKRGADPFTIAYVDVDNLKVVNDTLGHAAGDELIRTVASTLHRSVRNADVVVRLGGDEFCLGLPNCSAAQAAKVAARIDANLAALSTDPGSTRVVRVSHGFGEYSGGKLEPDVDALLEKADAEMYAAKQAKKKARAGS